MARRNRFERKDRVCFVFSAPFSQCCMLGIAVGHLLYD